MGSPAAAGPSEPPARRDVWLGGLQPGVSGRESWPSVPRVVIVCRLARGKCILSAALCRLLAPELLPRLVKATSSWISAVVCPFCSKAPPAGGTQRGASASCPAVLVMLGISPLQGHPENPIHPQLALPVGSLPAPQPPLKSEALVPSNAPETPPGPSSTGSCSLTPRFHDAHLGNHQINPEFLLPPG